MRKLLLFALNSLLCLSGFSQVLDTSRFPRDTWPYWQAGLIYNGALIYTTPVYSVTTYFTNAAGYVPDGVTDNSQAWTNAYNAAPDLSTIVMPPTNTVITNFMIFNSSKRVRVIGTGIWGGQYQVGKSMLQLSAGTNSSVATIAPIIIGNDATRNKALVTNGFARGSSTLFLNSVSGMAAGQHVRFYATNDNVAYVKSEYKGNQPGGCGNTDGHDWGYFEGQFSFCSISYAHIGQSFQIVSVNNANQSITVSSPVYWQNYSLSDVPTAEAFVNTATGIGLENLVINYQGKGDYIIYNIWANDNWITGCCLSNSQHAFIQLSDCNNCLVRGNQTWFHVVMDSNAREGCALGGYASDNLIENNSFEGGNIAVKSQLSASGNVIAYNFSHIGWVTNSGNPTIDGSVYCPVTGTHGDMAMFELWEGNIAAQYSGDSFWGGSRGGTLLRNWWTRDGYAGVPVANIRFNQGTDVGAYIDSTNWYYTAIGNVFGSGRDVGDAVGTHIIAAFGYARSELPTPNSPSTSPGNPADTNVAFTLLYHGNYNMVSQSAQWSNGIPQVVSNSYYLKSKPYWFGNMTWPATGPDVSASIASLINLSNTIEIPAQAFEMFGTNPVAGSSPGPGTVRAIGGAALGGSAL